MPHRTGKVSHTTVVAYLALFVALGGSAYAAATITGADVVDRSLTGVDIRNGTVRSADDAGVRIQGPGSSIVVDNSGVSVDGAATTEIRAGASLRLTGSQIQLNGACRALQGSTTVFDC
jgi:hypothetical protein